MKLSAVVVAAAACVAVAQASNVHIRVHSKHGHGHCTIENESQCDGQNWTGSTCCRDSNYECRWSDDGQNVKRCQKKHGGDQHPGQHHGDHHQNDEHHQHGGHHDHHHHDHHQHHGEAAVWQPCTNGEKCVDSVCVKHSQWYSQCKPHTLPQGELCGQNDGTNVWKYDACPGHQECKPMGTDFRCQNRHHHQKHHHKSHKAHKAQKAHHAHKKH